MERKFNSSAFSEMCKIREELEEKLLKAKGNRLKEEIYRGKIKIVNRCINALYLR